MTTPIDIDPLKSSLIEKEEIHKALAFALEKKKTESELLPPAIAGKNAICVDLVKLISEETSEYERLSSVINSKKVERDFLTQQIADHENIEAPSSILMLVNKLDNEILSDTIYCEALRQSIIVQTSTHNALMESVYLETTEYEDLDPKISTLKEKTEQLAVEIATATEEYETLSSKVIVIDNEENSAATVDQGDFSFDVTETSSDQDISENENNEVEPNKQNFEETHTHHKTTKNEELTHQLAVDLEQGTNSFDSIEQQIEAPNSDLALKQSSITDDLDADHQEFNNDPTKAENIHEDPIQSEHFDNIDAELNKFSIDPIETIIEQDIAELNATISPPVHDSTDNLSDGFEIEQLDNTKDLDSLNTELDTFSIDPVEKIIEQDITELNSTVASSEKNSIENEFGFDSAEIKINSDTHESIIISETITQPDTLSLDSIDQDATITNTDFSDSTLDSIDSEYKHDDEELKNESNTPSTDLNKNQNSNEETGLNTFSMDPVELTNKLYETTLASSESNTSSDEFRLDKESFENELDQYENLSKDELTSEIIIDKDDDHKTTITLDKEQDFFSIDPAELPNEKNGSELKAALATVELNDIEDEFRFGEDFNEEIPVNNRTTTRYVRTDIKTKLIVYRLLGASKPFDIELLDVSSKGAFIKTSTKLRKNARITLKFNFQLDARRFAIAGKVVRKATDIGGGYGIKFSSSQDEFADHLLNTQTSLVFK